MIDQKTWAASDRKDLGLRENQSLVYLKSKESKKNRMMKTHMASFKSQQLQLGKRIGGTYIRGKGKAFLEKPYHQEPPRDCIFRDIALSPKCAGHRRRKQGSGDDKE